jgi:predicted nucleotidyltransferase
MSNIHPIEHLPAAAENPRSVAYVDALQETAQGVKQVFPEYKGMTLYGSTSRGETGPESDVDVFVFMEVNSASEAQATVPDQNHRLMQFDEEGPAPGTFYFVPQITSLYKDVIKDELQRQGFPEADIAPLPVSDEIVEDAVVSALKGAQKYDELGEGGPVAPRNIRCLFHASIDDTNLQKYRQQVLESFSESPHGRTAWRMLRFMAATYETRPDAHPDTLSHRYFPETLDQALEYYKAPLLSIAAQPERVALDGLVKESQEK